MTTPQTAIGDNGKKLRLPSPRVRQAIDLLMRGEATTQTAAAQQVGYSRAELSRQLGKPHVQDYIRNLAKALRTTDLLPAALCNVRKAIADGNTDVSMTVLKEEGVVSHPRGTAQGAGIGAAGGIHLTISIAPQHAGSDLPHVVSGTVIEAEATHYGENGDDETE